MSVLITVDVPTPQDGVGIARVLCESPKEAYKNILHPSILKKYNTQHMLKVLQIKNKKLSPEVQQHFVHFVAKRGAQVVGYVQGFTCAKAAKPERTFSHDGAWLNRLFVDPNYQNKGIGSMLLDAFNKHCKKHGQNKVYLYAMQDYAPSRKFYENKGGTLVPNHIGSYSEDGYDYATVAYCFKI